MPQKSNTRYKIMIESVRLFGQYGYNSVSMRQIANAVGIKGGSIYNHFESKGDILDQTINYIVRQFSSYLPSLWEIQEHLVTKSPKEVLSYFLFDYPSEDLPFFINMYRVVFAEQYHIPALRNYLLEDLLNVQVAYIRQVLEILVDLKRIPSCDVHALSSTIVRCMVVFALEATLDFNRLEEIARLKCQICGYLVDFAIQGFPITR